MAFMDMAGQYLQNRMDQAQQPLDAFGQETEEERRRRQMREDEEARLKNLQSVGQITPVTQTVKTNPITGEQEMTVKGRPEDLSAANPLTPTVTAPAVPGQTVPQMSPNGLNPDIQSRIDQIMPPAQVTAVNPSAPAVTDQSQLGNQFNYPMVGPGLSQPMLGVSPANKEIYTDMPVGARVGINNEEIVGPGGQTYNYNQLQNAAEDYKFNLANTLPPAVPVAQPVSQTQPMMAPAPAPVAPAPVAPTAPMMAPQATTPMAPVNPAAPPPAPAPTMTPVATPPAEQNWQDRITTAKTSDDFKAIMMDPNTPDDVRRLSAGQYSKSLEVGEKEKKANTFIDNATPNDLIKAMRKNTEEGSYVKAILFSRLGLNELAKEEQQKLGAGSAFQSLVSGDGTRYTAQVNGQGAVIAAYDTTGKRVDDTTLASLSAQGALAKGAHVNSTMLRDRTTGEIYYQRTLPNGSTQLISPKGGIYAGPMNNLYAYGIGSDLDTKNAIQLQTLRNRLLVEPQIDAAKELAKFNAMNGTSYSINDIMPNAAPYQMGGPGQAPTAGAPAQTSTGQPVDSGAAIKNNNPGNIRYGTVAKDMGATGRAPNGMAIFPDLSTGTSAQEKLLSSPAYKNLTLGQAIAKWAPNNENNPAEYLRYMKRETGLDMDKEFKDLNANDKQTFLSAQARFEHGLPSAAGKGGVNAPPTAVAATPSQAPTPQPGESPNVFTARFNAWSKENEKTTGAELAKVQNAKAVYDVIKEINTALPKATGSGIGERIDNVYRFFGTTNEGMKATAQLQILGDRLLKSVPRFEGPQSDRDVQSYKEAAADLANSKKTVPERQAAFQTIQALNKKYLPGVDWDMTNPQDASAASSNIRIIKREKIQ